MQSFGNEAGIEGTTRLRDAITGRSFNTRKKLQHSSLGISNKSRKCLTLVPLAGEIRLAIGKAACMIFLNRMLIN